jgi:hypothetical protein
MNVILGAARAAYAAGLAPVPVSNNGSKAPDVRQWKQYTMTRPTVDEMRAFNFAAHDGLGIIAGAGIRHRECWDFDVEDVFVAFVDRAHLTGLGVLVHRLTAGYLDKTPGGGRRIIVAYPSTLAFKDVTLARRPGRAGEPALTFGQLGRMVNCASEAQEEGRHDGQSARKETSEFRRLDEQRKRQAEVGLYRLVAWSASSSGALRGFDRPSGHASCPKLDEFLQQLIGIS